MTVMDKANCATPLAESGSTASSPPILEFHPSFDPLTGTWFLVKPRVEAPSLKLLAALLAKRKHLKQFKLVGYCPDGYSVTWHKTTSLESARVHLPVSTGNEHLYTKKEPARVPVFKKIVSRGRVQNNGSATHKLSPTLAAKHEAILALWAQGLTGPEIGKKLGLRSATSAAVFIADYRKKHPGDTRAKRRMKF
jgi:hypothetical protein